MSQTNGRPAHKGGVWGLVGVSVETSEQPPVSVVFLRHLCFVHISLVMITQRLMVYGTPGALKLGTWPQYCLAFVEARKGSAEAKHCLLLAMTQPPWSFLVGSKKRGAHSGARKGSIWKLGIH